MGNAELLGHPDFVFPEGKLAVFLDGCFWHGCPTCYRRPRSNVKYWDRKLALNKARDLRVRAELNSRGWRVLRFWEHKIKKDVLGCLKQLSAELDHN